MSDLPPPSTDCAFGPKCPSKPEGRPYAQEICGFCKNRAILGLLDESHEQKEENPGLKTIVHKYVTDLFNEKNRRMRAREAPLCATKDATYYRKLSLQYFDAQSYGPCGPVQEHGQLCERCYDSAKRQCAADTRTWLYKEFDGNLWGWTCVFFEPRLSDPENNTWKYEVKDKRGRPEEDWFPRTKCRSRNPTKSTLCEKCYSRVSVLWAYGSIFKNGTLREDWALNYERLKNKRSSSTSSQALSGF